jgi:MFS transporter, ACS family, tartrate transporter
MDVRNLNAANISESASEPFFHADTHYTIPQSFLTGAAAARGLAFINSVGAFGGFVGPYLIGYLKDANGSFNAGMLGMAAILVVSFFIAASLKLVIKNA